MTPYARAAAALSILLLAHHATAFGQRAAPTPLNNKATSVVVAIRDGDGRAFGDLLYQWAHGGGDSSVARAVSPLLESPQASVRMRAAMSLGAIGPAAGAHAGVLAPLVNDGSLMVRGEAAFALRALGISTPEVIESLLNASRSERDPAIRKRVQLALSDLLIANGPVVATPSLTRSIQRELTDSSAATRAAAARSLRYVDAPWKLGALRRLLADPIPSVRLPAAYTLAAIRPRTAAVREDLERLAFDSSKRVSGDVPDLLDAFADSSRAIAPACLHRDIDSTGNGTVAVIPTTFTLLPGSASLRGDGAGPYGQNDSVQSYHSFAYNMNLIDPSKVPGYLSSAYNSRSPQSGRDTAAPRGRTARSIDIDLSHPLTATQANLGIIHDSTMHFGAFFMFDDLHRIWNTRDIPVGARIRSDHTDITFVAAGIPYYMQFGPWSISVCASRFGRGHGDGSDPVIVERLSAGTFRMVAPPGTRGRLWNYTNPAAAVDLGLYEMSFQVLVTAKP